ncbi:hypothetical protein LMG29739_01759 [Paraburkholderia solisilvae]|uniref:Uncharacterized protein n=3 Tax=Paraburkholderia solisilvae TaxID=624376 RepID=A0A6J5DJZ8_9BURK|nr:hypothetical protein LMG29739_01759 [Paraburkholderia solisilvae]
MLFKSKTMSIPFDFQESGESPPGCVQRIEFDLSSDRHALSAVEAYADACEHDMPWLSAQLRTQLQTQLRTRLQTQPHSSHTAPDDRATRCGQTVLRVFSLARAWAADKPDFSNPAWEHVQISLKAAIAHLSAERVPDDAGDAEHAP